MPIRLCLATALLLALAVPEALAEDRRPAEDAEVQAARLVAAMKSGRPEEQVAAAKEAATCPHPSLLKSLLRLLASPEQAVREAATKALGARTEKGDKKKAAAALNPRLARLSRKAEDKDELRVVIAALDALAQPSSIKPLLADIEADTDGDIAQARLNAVAGVPHKDAIERLIQFLARGRKHNRHNAGVSKALHYATGQSLGRDPDRWRAWWRDNEKSFDFEAFARARAGAEAERKANSDKKAERKRRKKERKDGGKPEGKGGSPKKPID